MSFYGVVVSTEDLFWHFAKERYPEREKSLAIKQYIYDQRIKIVSVEFNEDRRQEFNKDPLYYGRRCVDYYKYDFLNIPTTLFIHCWLYDDIVYIGSYNSDNCGYIIEELSTIAALESLGLDKFQIQKWERKIDINLPKKEKLC